MRKNENVTSKTKVLLREGSSRAFDWYPFRRQYPTGTQSEVYRPITPTPNSGLSLVSQAQQYGTALISSSVEYPTNERWRYNRQRQRLSRGSVPPHAVSCEGARRVAWGSGIFRHTRTRAPQSSIITPSDPCSNLLLSPLTFEHIPCRDEQQIQSAEPEEIYHLGS